MGQEKRAKNGRRKGGKEGGEMKKKKIKRKKEKGKGREATSYVQMCKNKLSLNVQAWQSCFFFSHSRKKMETYYSKKCCPSQHLSAAGKEIGIL